MTGALRQTPSQTIGPFFTIGLNWDGGATLTSAATEGERIHLLGRVLDAAGEPVTDALVEIWQADAAGRYSSPDFPGFGRCSTDVRGAFRFATIHPGRVPGPHGTLQAPHIQVGVFARGLLKRVFTRCYFPGETANEADPILAVVPRERRATLIARKLGDAAVAFEFDVVLRGPAETVFFDC